MDLIKLFSAAEGRAVQVRAPRTHRPVPGPAGGGHSLG